MFRDRVHRGGCDPRRPAGRRQRLRQRVRRSVGQSQRHRQMRRIMRLQVQNLGGAQGQRAGLVKDHAVDFRQPFQCGSAFDQHAAPEQAPAGRGHDRGHRQPKRAGAGDDQHRRGDVDGQPRVARRGQPAQKRPRRQQMNRRRIEARCPVRQRGIAGARGLGHGDQFRHPRQRAVAPGMGHQQGQRPGQVRLSGGDHIARLGQDGLAFAGQDGAVQLAAAARHDAVDRHAPAGTHQHQIARNQIGHGHNLLAVGAKARGARYL